MNRQVVYYPWRKNSTPATFCAVSRQRQQRRSFVPPVVVRTTCVGNLDRTQVPYRGRRTPHSPSVPCSVSVRRRMTLRSKRRCEDTCLAQRTHQKKHNHKLAKFRSAPEKKRASRRCQTSVTQRTVDDERKAQTLHWLSCNCPPSGLCLSLRLREHDGTVTRTRRVSSVAL